MARRDYVGIYKPKRNYANGTGGAVAQFKLGAQRDCMFLELAKQTDAMDSPRPYDWENTRISIKLGIADIGKLLSLFNGTWPLAADPQKPDLDIFHVNAKGNKALKIKKQDRGYYLKASISEKGETNRQDSIAIPIGWDEAELIRLALERGYTIMLGW